MLQVRSLVRPLHKGHMDKDSQSLEAVILRDSGGGKLEGNSTSMAIIIDENGHRYELDYQR